MFYTVPWFPELGSDREVPGKAMTITLMAALVCNRELPCAYQARVNVFYLRTGLDYDLCKYAVWLALELGMIEWYDDPDWLQDIKARPV